jgi:hypothetical protein
MSGWFDLDRIPESLERIDALIESTDNEERLRSGLGMRLALSMAHEVQKGLPPGDETSELVASWTERYGSDRVEAAVTIAREFIQRPSELTQTFAEKLGLRQNSPNP